MPTGKTRGPHRAKRAIGQPQVKRHAVIGVQWIFANLIAGGFGKGRQAGRDIFDLLACNEGCEIKDMDAHIPQDPLRSMLG